MKFETQLMELEKENHSEASQTPKDIYIWLYVYVSYYAFDK